MKYNAETGPTDGERTSGYEFMKHRIRKILLVCWQLRRVHSGRGRPYRAADQPGVHRPEHVQPAGAAARQLDGRGARPAPRGRSVRLHPHDVQRGRTRRVRLRQDRQGAPPAYPCRVADQFLEGHLPPYRRARRFGHRLHLLVERQYRSGDRHHQTHRGCDERRGGHPHRGRSGHPARRRTRCVSIRPICRRSTS